VQIEIACRHGHIRDEVREQISQKAAKLLTYFERVTAIVVTIDLKVADSVKVEIQVDAEHKHDFVASHENPDALAAFDQALHKMEHQIVKYKEKVQDHRRDRPLNEYVKGDV
jgi:putative sigma-54 modulation protein